METRPLKALHVAFSYYPDPVGGTEVYVEGLCKELQRIGVESVITAPAGQSRSYAHHGVRVRRFGIQNGPMDLEQLYGRGDDQAAASFGQILEEERPDIVHQHASSPACSVQLAQRAKARGLPVVFTYHTPTTSCQRGTLMEFGATPCDGRVEVRRCSACALQGLGVGRVWSDALARTPQWAGDLLGLLGLGGGPWTALRTPSLMRERARSVRQVFSLADRLIALSPWVEALLRNNGVPAGKIVVSPHGVAAGQSGGASKRPAGRLRILHLGRVDPAKGTAVLIQAVRLIPRVALSLHVYGIVQGAARGALLQKLEGLAGSDTRISFLPAVDHEQVPGLLTGYDLLAVPSQWLEAGPLVVLEAFAAGVPVLGSALPGIADKVKDGVDGLLVQPHDSVEAWAAAIARCAEDRDLVGRLARGVCPPRSMADVAGQMKAVYRELIAS